MLIIGIDSGLTGGIAAIDEKGGYVSVEDLPVVDGHLNPAELSKQLGKLHAFSGPIRRVIIENQWAFPKAKGGVCTAFKKGDCFGVIKGVCATLDLPFELVSPQKWKKAWKLGKDKEKSRALAQQFYPMAPLGRKKDHGLAEALLIARYAALQPNA